MSYTVLVFVKQVPDTQNITGDAMKADGTVNRAALPAIFNPEDLNALEMALELKDRYGVKVVVATMGPPAAAEVLRSHIISESLSVRQAEEAVRAMTKGTGQNYDDIRKTVWETGMITSMQERMIADRALDRLYGMARKVMADAPMLKPFSQVQKA